MLVESADDILQALRPMLGGSFREPEPVSTDGRFSFAETDRADGRLRSTLLELLAPSPIEIDDLIRRCDAPAAAVTAVLLELELAGRVRRHPGNRASLG